MGEIQPNTGNGEMTFRRNRGTEGPDQRSYAGRAIVQVRKRTGKQERLSPTISPFRTLMVYAGRSAGVPWVEVNGEKTQRNCRGNGVWGFGYNWTEAVENGKRIAPSISIECMETSGKGRRIRRAVHHLPESDLVIRPSGLFYFDIDEVLVKQGCVAGKGFFQGDHAQARKNGETSSGKEAHLLQISA
jgi:hypothetical protein